MQMSKFHPKFHFRVQFKLFSAVDNFKAFFCMKFTKITSMKYIMTYDTGKFIIHSDIWHLYSRLLWLCIHDTRRMIHCHAVRDSILKSVSYNVISYAIPYHSLHNIPADSTWSPSILHLTVCHIVPETMVYLTQYRVISFIKT